MLCLSLVPGEYLTIGEDIVIQVDRAGADRCKLVIHAPREIPVLRGEVLERGGKPRPECVFETTRWRTPEIPWSRSKAQALNAMRSLLSQMDGGDGNVQTLRRQLNHMFPPERRESGDTPRVSNG